MGEPRPGGRSAGDGAGATMDDGRWRRGIGRRVALAAGRGMAAVALIAGVAVPAASAESGSAAGSGAVEAAATRTWVWAAAVPRSYQGQRCQIVVLPERAGAATAASVGAALLPEGPLGPIVPLPPVRPPIFDPGPIGPTPIQETQVRASVTYRRLEEDGSSVRPQVGDLYLVRVTLEAMGLPCSARTPVVTVGLPDATVPVLDAPEYPTECTYEPQAGAQLVVQQGCLTLTPAGTGQWTVAGPDANRVPSGSTRTFEFAVRTDAVLAPGAPSGNRLTVAVSGGGLTATGVAVPTTVVVTPALLTTTFTHPTPPTVEISSTTGTGVGQICPHYRRGVLLAQASTSPGFTTGTMTFEAGPAADTSDCYDGIRLRLFGLASGTTYHWRFAFEVDGERDVGPTQSFTTSGDPGDVAGGLSGEATIGSATGEATETGDVDVDGGFVGVDPVRALDTRTAGGPVCAEQQIVVRVTGLGAVPSSGVGAVALNVTAVDTTEAGYLTVFPDGASRPTASHVNFRAGDIAPNAVMAKVSDDGEVAIYNSNGCTHVVVDVLGWFVGGNAGPGGFTGIDPVRLVDTREGDDPRPLCEGQTGVMRVAGFGDLPASGIGAVALNVTAVDTTQAGYLTVFPAGAERPNASNVNFVAGDIAPNAVIAKVGDDGQVAVYNSNGCSHLVVDAVGWFAPGQPAPGGLTGVEPVRAVDTRSGRGPLCAGEELSVRVTGLGQVPPAGAAGVALNVTAVDTTEAGYLTVFPSGSPRPPTSNVNFVAGDIAPNAVMARVGDDGEVTVYNSNGCSHVVVDVLGWFAA